MRGDAPGSNNGSPIPHSGAGEGFGVRNGGGLIKWWCPASGGLTLGFALADDRSWLVWMDEPGEGALQHLQHRVSLAS